MQTSYARRMALVSLPLIVIIWGACGVAALPATHSPRWACPSPTPLPYGAEGPVRDVEPCNCRPDPETQQPVCDECPLYYRIWEQEYSQFAGPPFPSPTPYARVGTAFAFGQRVIVGPLALLASARAGATISGQPGIPDGSLQLYFLRFEVLNRASTSLPLPLHEHARLRAIRTTAGAIVSNDTWGFSALAQHLTGMPLPPAVLPVGTTIVEVPVLAPPGEPEVVELALFADPQAFATLADPAQPAPPPPQPTTNVALRVNQPERLVIQWSNTVWVPPGAERCDDPGAITEWENAPNVAWGEEVALGVVRAPPGSSRLVQIALNQVGKPYVWGAKGPEAFDCSGLTEWSYGQIGVRIPRGTAGQWPSMRPLTVAELQPGDLIFFDISGNGRIDHVGLLADVNSDGQWDLIHAANPSLGVRVDYGVLTSPYYQPRIRGFRTAR